MKILAAFIVLITIYIIQSILFRKNWFKNLDLDMSFSRDYIECGESADLIEIVTNDKYLPLPTFNMKFSVDRSLKFDEKDNSIVTDYYHKNEVFSVMGHQRVVRKLSFQGTHRGVFGVQNANFIVHDFFMTRKYAGQMRNTDFIYIFPKKITTDRFNVTFKGVMGELETKRNIIEDSMSFRGIREYQPFDPYRSINWKQSAKARELMVNMRGFTTDSRVRILLNLENDNMIESEKLIEEAISLASSFARQFIGEKVNVSLATNALDKDGNQLPSVGEGAELKHAITIDRMLAEISGSNGLEAFQNILNEEIKNISSDSLYLVISPYAKDDLLMLLDRIIRLEGAVHMIVPYYDEYPYVKNRSYTEGWEVPLNV